MQDRFSRLRVEESARSYRKVTQTLAKRTPLAQRSARTSVDLRARREERRVYEILERNKLTICNM